MQQGVEEGASAGSSQTLLDAHAALVRDRSLQFERSDFVPPKAPDWLAWLADALKAVAPVLKWVFWIGVALLVTLILYAIVRELRRLGAPRPKPVEHTQPDEAEWRPDAAAARDLLAAADQLANQGRYAEASHLLLLRSVEDIQSRRPNAVRIALTTREIATLAVLPEAARPAFAKIGQVVERSLFGGAVVGADDFADCRRDYEAFALPQGWAT